MSGCLAIIIKDAERRKVKQARADIEPFIVAAESECRAIAALNANERESAEHVKGGCGAPRSKEFGAVL